MATSHIRKNRFPREQFQWKLSGRQIPPEIPVGWKPVSKSACGAGAPHLTMCYRLSVGHVLIF